jgi:branched-chain amino acid transport system substrate-binding protein
VNAVKNRASLYRTSRPLVAALALGISSALALSVLPAQAATTPGVTDTEIVLGMQLPQTGPAAPGYNKVDDAMRAYFDYVNSKGGVNGRKITLVAEDDAYRSGRTITTARGLYNKVFAMVGSVGTQTHISVIRDINRRGIPDLFVNSGYSGFYTDPKKYPTTFGGLGTYTVEAKILGKYIKENFADKKVGIVYQTDDFGRNTKEGLTTAGVTFTRGTTEATFVAGSQGVAGALVKPITQLRDNKVDVVVVGAVASAFAVIVATAKQLGYNPSKWIVISVGGDATTFQGILAGQGIPAAVSGSWLNGVISASHAPAPGDADDEWVKAFKKINDDFNKATGAGKSWDNNVLQGMNIAYLTTAALQGAGKNLTRPGIIKFVKENASKLSNAAFAPLGYSATTHEAYTGFWIGAYDATTVLKPIDGTRKMWTTDSGKGPVTELKYTRPKIAADALPKVG